MSVWCVEEIIELWGQFPERCSPEMDLSPPITFVSMLKMSSGFFGELFPGVWFGILDFTQIFWELFRDV